VLTTVEILAVVLLVAANAFFVAAEYAFVAVRRLRLQELTAGGSRRARHVLRLLERPGRFMATIQLGITFTTLAIGAVGQPVVSRLLRDVLEPMPGLAREPVAAVVAAAIAFLILSFLHATIGEIVPRAYALEHPEGAALAAATPLRAFSVVLAPFAWVVDRVSAWLLRTLRIASPGEAGAAHSEEELKLLVSASGSQGVLQEEEQRMLHRVFEFADKDAADVLVPRPDMVALQADTPVADALQVVLERPYTRYPVYAGDLDDILGILHVRDLFRRVQRGDAERLGLRGMIRPAIVVPETKQLDELLGEFRRSSSHMAIVVDEYGSVAGLVTLEDVLEEIVGEIGDEFDLPDTAIRRVGRGRVRVDGGFAVEDFNDRFGRDLPSDDYHTVGGWVFGELGRAPRVGDVVASDGVRFEVSAVDGPRIVEVDVTLAVPGGGAHKA
jgi:CBS domain containing-hemolysin-like protein